MRGFLGLTANTVLPPRYDRCHRTEEGDAKHELRAAGCSIDPKIYPIHSISRGGHRFRDSMKMQLYIPLIAEIIALTLLIDP